MSSWNVSGLDEVDFMNGCQLPPSSQTILLDRERS
jgi:hypothetical protein